ncbi:MAG: nucleoside kinase [bacterium]
MNDKTTWIDITGTRSEIKPGTTLREELHRSGGEDIWGNDPVVLATINGRRACLAEPLWGEERINLIRLSDPEAHSTSLHSLCFVLAAAARELFPANQLVIDFSYQGGIYCELRREAPLEPAELDQLRERMWKLIKKDLALTPHVYGMRDLLRLLQKSGHSSSFRTARYIRRDSITLFRMEGTDHLFYGLQLPSTGLVRAFEILPESPGFVLVPSLPGEPDRVPVINQQPKLLETMREYSRWMDRIKVQDIGRLNHYVMEGRADELIQVCEARHNRVIVQTAERVAELPAAGRLILVAGPSSSGKTSFAKRLEIQLRVLGFEPYAISLDDYFVDRQDTPQDPDGDYDYESLAAIKIELFNKQLQTIMAGEPVRLPRYDFHTGTSRLRDESLTLPRGNPLIVEGIHALNPGLTPAIPGENKLQVYVSALCHMNIDNFSYIPTTLTRLYRRIVRDAQFRGYPASETLKRWPKVRHGEEKHIFPFQQNADVFFNSGLAYELSVLKLWAEPRLAAVDPDDPNYSRARSLIEMLTLLLPIDARQVPPTSLLREFIGGSGFQH